MMGPFNDNYLNRTFSSSPVCVLLAGVPGRQSGNWKNNSSPDSVNNTCGRNEQL
jgi:hypothetical protein